jgi:dienelactone hydrolase
MTTLKQTLFWVSLVFATISQAKEVVLTTQDDFKLKAEYFSPEKSQKKGVLLLHQCNLNRSMYDDLGAKLARRGIHALSLDFRSYGGSIDEATDPVNIRKNPKAKRREIYQAIRMHWPNDTLDAYNFLKDKVGTDGKIGVVGASCGGAQGLTLALENNISAISFFSSYLEDKDIQTYQGCITKIPAFIIAAEKDGVFSNAQKLFEEAEHVDTKFTAYKGDGHGYPLFSQDPTLTNVIVEWFDTQL